MKKSTMSMLSVVATLAALAAFSLSAAQAATIKDGVYTAEQAEAGQAIYERRCGACHSVDFYKTTFANRNNQPLLFMFEEILGTMPADMPGSLMDDEYEKVLAHILSITGFPAGDAPLSYSNGSMANIAIVRPD
jgi:mono/diheme cytochrome c family protein